jgi:Fic family protein
MSKNYPINPDREKPWNDLPSLPIAKELYYTIEITERLGDAKVALGKLQGRSAAIPNQGIFINTISLQEAKASSEIENIFTTDDELYKAFSDKNADDKDGASKEVLRYREALWIGYNYLKKKPGFNQDYFIKIYQEIKQTKDTIRPAFVPTIIRQGGSGANAGKIVYTPPRGKGVIEEKLNNLIDFINDDVAYQIDPLLKMIIGHYQFEAIHPFRDGNGRTGRVFNIHYLTKKGLLDLPILFLSRYIIENKDDYYKKIEGISQRGDWKAWIVYMLKAVEATSNITYNKINDIISVKEAILKTIADDTDIRRPEQIIEMIFTQPLTKVKHLVDGKAYAENTARDYLNKLCEIGVLEKKVIQGNHYYQNIELVRILSE